MKVKNILISQPEPKLDSNSPYQEIADKYKLKLEFRQFIQVAGVNAADFRKDKINPQEYNAVIFTSRNAIDHYFRICEEMRISISSELKYFCQSEAVAHYLQKYVIYRKRKIYFGNGEFKDLVPHLKKHKEEKFLLPSSDVLNPDIPSVLNDYKFKYTRAVLYKTVSADLKEINIVTYDMLVFFSPAGIQSLFQNFPNFVQGNTRIATFGPNTTKAAEEAGLTVNLKAPSEKNPSMTMAIEEYVREANKSR